MTLISDFENRFNYRVILAAFVALVGFFSGLRTILAAEKDEIPSQTRDFVVMVNGKQQGTCKMRVDRLSDNSEIVYGEASVRANYLVYTYNYKSKGEETWKDGRLHRLQNSADFNGTKYQVQAAKKGEDLFLDLNGKKRKIGSDVWLTSYWRQPDRQWHNQALRLLDPDKGEDRQATLKFIGNESVPVVGKSQKCAHYQLRGGVDVDLWYDSQERLVRQESKEFGHRVIMELKQIANDTRKPGPQVADKRE